MMYILNGRRVNLDAEYTSADGVTFNNLRHLEIRQLLGVEEVSEPQPPEDYSEATYYKTEQETSPFVVYTRKPEDLIKQAKQVELKTSITQIEEQSKMPRPVRKLTMKQAESTMTAEELARDMDYQAIKQVEDRIQELRNQLASL